MMNDYTFFENELKWFEQLLHWRSKKGKWETLSFQEILSSEKQGAYLELPNPADYPTSLWAKFVEEHQFSVNDRLLLTLVLIPYLKPASLGRYLGVKSDDKDALSMMSLVQGGAFLGKLPTGYSYLFLVAGKNFRVRVEEMRRIAANQSPLLKMELIKIGGSHEVEPALSGPLKVEKRFALSMVTNTPEDQLIYT